jgi:hypothetical protein
LGQQNKEAKTENGDTTVWETAITQKERIRGNLTKEEFEVVEIAHKASTELRQEEFTKNAINVLTELQTVQAGSRLVTEDSEGNKQTKGQKSTFPDWFSLRTKKEVDAFLMKIPENIAQWNPSNNPFPEGSKKFQAWNEFVKQVGKPSDFGMNADEYLKGDPEFKKAIEDSIGISVDELENKVKTALDTSIREQSDNKTGQIALTKEMAPKEPEIKAPVLKPAEKASITKVEKQAAQTPVSQGLNKLKDSKAYTRIVEKLDAQFKDQPQYEKMNIAEDAARALEFIDKNYSDGKKIALGLKAPPEGITDTAISIATAEKALQDGDYELYSQLERSRSLRQTRRGQEIVAERGRVNENSPAYYLDQVAERRIQQAFQKSSLLDGVSIKEAFIGKSEPKKASEAKKLFNDYVQKEAKKIKETISPEEIKISRAQEIIDLLTCK